MTPDPRAPLLPRLRGHSIAKVAVLGFVLLGLSGVGLQAARGPTSRNPHQAIKKYEGPVTCLQCHADQAQAMFGSVHYQQTGPTPNVTNVDGPAGERGYGAIGFNSYCGTHITSSRATCSSCHVGNGQFPSPTMTVEQLANIDCLMCHQDQYQRTPAPPYTTIDVVAPGGGFFQVTTPVEDENGYFYMPDAAKMTVTPLEAARTVHLPTRASCLRCHAGAGGSDGGKRGDISTVTANPPVSSDVHMSPAGVNLACANCHDAGGHRVMGRGLDLHPNDVPERLECSSCHGERPHGDYGATKFGSRDTHALRVACQACHIPTFAKDMSTEMFRDWRHSEYSPKACRGQGGWLPSEVRASNVVPTYNWFDGTSRVYVLGEVPETGPDGILEMALPNGDVRSAGARLYPMKEHRSTSAQHLGTGQLIPHSTMTYFRTGDFDLAIQDGQAMSGLEGPYAIAEVREFQTINHGVERHENALECGDCHGGAGFDGGPARMNLARDYGYELKGPTTQVCTQCHSLKTSKGFKSNHEKHVSDKRYDCSVCHNFTRTERNR